MMSDDEESWWESRDSGSFCRHWDDDVCSKPCVCGHTCFSHPWGSCDVDGCDCEEFKDPEGDGGSDAV